MNHGPRHQRMNLSFNQLQLVHLKNSQVVPIGSKDNSKLLVKPNLKRRIRCLCRISRRKLLARLCRGNSLSILDAFGFKRLPNYFLRQEWWAFHLQSSDQWQSRQFILDGIFTLTYRGQMGSRCCFYFIEDWIVHANLTIVTPNPLRWFWRALTYKATRLHRKNWSKR